MGWFFGLVGIFLRDWNDFAAKTEFGSVLEYFCRIEFGLKIFFPKRRKKSNLDLENFCPKKQKGEGDLDVE